MVDNIAITKANQITIWIRSGLGNDDGYIQLLDFDAGCRVVIRDYGYWKRGYKVESMIERFRYAAVRNELEAVLNTINDPDIGMNMCDGHGIQVQIIDSGIVTFIAEFGDGDSAFKVFINKFIKGMSKK